MTQGIVNLLHLRQRFSSVFLVTAMLLAGSTEPQADETTKGVAVAPAGTDVFETSFEGTWFVNRQLKQSYDAVIAEVQTLEQRVRSGELSVAEARESIAKLRESLTGLKARIDKEKTLVSPFEIVRQEVEGRINLGPERLLVVTADRIKIVGWDEPYARYVIVKQVLSTGTPVEEHLAGIKIIHEHKVSPELVGKTDAEMDAWRDDFLNPKGELDQTPEQMENRRRMWDRHFATGERFQPFVGREVDSLRIEGLIYQEGNQHLPFELKRPEGGGQFGSRWRRNAEVTLYVPKCTALLLRGCQRGMDISGVHGHLMMTSTGSTDRDYNGHFAIRDHIGPVTLLNVPMDVIERVTGDINIASTTEMANTGSHHSSGDWVLTVPAPRRLQVSDVSGNLTGHFTRSELHIGGITGIINVRNDFGDTYCSIRTALTAGNHRLVSQSGLVSVRLADGTKTDGTKADETRVDMPVFAATSCGTVSTNLDRDELDDLNVAFTSSDGVRRDWRSLHTRLPQNDVPARFALHERPDEILADRERSHGLDLISVAGRVEYRREPHTNSK